jgi:hypothetical protein
MWYLLDGGTKPVYFSCHPEKMSLVQIVPPGTRKIRMLLCSIGGVVFVPSHISSYSREGNQLTTKDISKQTPQKRNTVNSTDGTVTFYLQPDGKLLIKLSRDDYPIPIDVQTTHALLNVLWINKDDIVREASKTNGIMKPGRSRERENKGENWS